MIADGNLAMIVSFGGVEVVVNALAAHVQLRDLTSTRSVAALAALVSNPGMFICPVLLGMPDHCMLLQTRSEWRWNFMPKCTS